MVFHIRIRSSPDPGTAGDAGRMPRKLSVDTDALTQLIERGHGVIRRLDLRRLGMSSSSINYRIRPGGPWQRLLPGVILAGGGPPNPLQRIRAALLYVGPDALVTGFTALRLHGVRGISVGEGVRLLIPHRRRLKSKSIAFVTIERTRRFPRAVWRSGIPCAPIARAVIDSARQLDELDAVRAVISAAVQQQRCPVSDLRAELDTCDQHYSHLPRLVLGEVTAGTRSVAEAKIRDTLRSAGIPEPHWNHDVFDASGQWLCRPDAVWPELGVVLEIDSMEWHLSPEAYRATQARQRRMTSAGLLVIPLAPSDITENPDDVVAEILETLATARTRTPPAIQAWRRIST